MCPVAGGQSQKPPFLPYRCAFEVARSLPAPSSHTSSFPLSQNPPTSTLGSLELLRGPEVTSDSPFPQVFSSAKYPAPERLQEYSSIFMGAQDSGLQRRPRHRIQSKHRPLDERALQV